MRFGGMWCLYLLLAVLAACSTPTTASEIYLVRHAEKATGEDPALTKEGMERANYLAAMLGDDRFIERVFSTDTQRTRQTAEPILRYVDTEVELYDARDLDAVAGMLFGTGVNQLVVGHSNTTPELAEALGCGPQAPMPETEYDRLIVVRVVGEDVDCRTERYGG